MDTGQRVFADVRRHVNSLEKRKAAALLEEEQAFANAQRNLEISTSTELSLKTLTSHFQEKYTALEDTYQEMKSALDREHKEMEAALDATLEQQLNEIKAAEEQQRSSLQDETAVRRRKAARALQERLVGKEWMSLRSRIEALGVPIEGLEESTVFLQNPEALFELQKSLEDVNVEFIPTSSTKPIQEPHVKTLDVQVADRDTIAKDYIYNRDSMVAVGETKETLRLTPGQTGSDKPLSRISIDMDRIARLDDANRKPSESGEILAGDSQIYNETRIEEKSKKRKWTDTEELDKHNPCRLQPPGVASKKMKKQAKAKTNSYRSENQIPSKSTPRIDEPQKLERCPIDDRSITCSYLFIAKPHIPVFQEMLEEMKKFFKECHATHVLADETGYYVLFTSKSGYRHMVECHQACKVLKTNLLGYKLITHKNWGK